MKFLLSALVLTFFTPYGTPPEHVARWIGIVWTGEMNHPIVPVFFTTEKRTPPKMSMTRYVRMTEQEYEALLRFTGGMQCPPVKFPVKKPYPKSIVIEEYAQRTVHSVCYFGPEDGCKYLFGISRLSGIDWSHKDAYPLVPVRGRARLQGPFDKRARYCGSA
jgi:hypothetical protein